MMQSIVSPALRAEPQLERFIERANATLVDIIGSVADRVTADWDLVVDNRGRRLVILELTDFSGSALTLFTPDEIRDGRRMLDRLYRLWGDLLQDRSHRQLRKVEQLVSQFEGEE